MVAWSGTVPQQAWQAGRLISPVAFPALTGVSGDLTYSAADVPSGVIVDFTSRTIYGIPETGGDGIILITVADDNTTAEIEVVYEIADRLVPIVVAPVPDLTMTLGQAFTYDFPQPEGGSGLYTTTLEALPLPPYDSRPVYFTNLPEGLSFTNGTLAGTVADDIPNRAQIGIAGVTLRNAQVSGNLTGFVSSATLSGSTFIYNGTNYVWREIRTNGDALEIRIDRTSGTGGGFQAFPNSPTLFIIRPSDNAVLFSVPLSVGVRPAGTIDRLIFDNIPFRFEAGETYYLDIGTSSRSRYNYVVTDNDTGQVVKVPFVLFLVAPDPQAPVAPVLETQQVGITTGSFSLSAVDDPDIVRVVAGAMPAGFPVNLNRLHNYAYVNREINEAFLQGLDPATEYDFYFYYEDDQGRRSVPLVITGRTEPARPAIPPLPVRGLAAEPGPNRLRLTWDDLPPFQRITNLQLRIDGGIWSDIPHSGGATSGYVVPGLVDGVPVTIEIRVVNPDGISPVATITATPGTGTPPPFRSPIQSRILIDFDGVFLALENRVLSATGEMGRQPGSFDLAPGWAEIVLLASDGFIRLTSPAEHQGFYTAEDLRNRQCLIQELYEDPTGRTVSVTRFGGWIEAAPLSSEGAEQIVTLSVVDRLGQYARRLVRFTAPLPREYADERAKRILAAAGVPDGEVIVPDNKVFCAFKNASYDSPYESSLLQLLAQVANSTGGRLLVIEDQQKDGLPATGQLCLEPARPTRPASATLSDNPDYDVAANPSWRPVGEIGNQPAAVLDPTNVYNTVEVALPSGEQVIASDPESVAVWGGRLFPVSDVIVERDEAEALARHALRVYSNPRLLADKVSCHLHFQDPSVALSVARLTLANTVRLSYLPAGTDDRVTAVQQIDHIRWQHLPGDRQYCQVFLEVGMLAPERSSYWIASHPGSNRLGTETFLAPVSADTLQTGGYDFTYDPDDLEPAYVTADRYGLLAGQSLPVYTSERERNDYEADPADGQGCIVAGDNGEGQSPRFYFHLDVYSSADNQWRTRAALSSAAANPLPDTLTWDTDRYDDGKTWAA